VKVAVCVKVVPSGGDYRLLETGKRLDRSTPGEMNPADLYAVEEALQIAAGTDGVETAMISMVSEGCTEALRLGLSMGIGRAVAIVDPLLEGSDLVATSKVLARAVQRETPDLILFGGQSAEGRGGMLWAAVAERLGMPAVAGVNSMTLRDGEILASQRTANGATFVAAPLPCIVSVLGSAHEPRYPSFRDVLAAKRKVIELLSVADIGLRPEDCGDEGSRTCVVGLLDRPRRQGGAAIFSGDRAVLSLYEYLVNRGLA